MTRFRHLHRVSRQQSDIYLPREVSLRGLLIKSALRIRIELQPYIPVFICKKTPEPDGFERGFTVPNPCETGASSGKPITTIVYVKRNLIYGVARPLTVNL